MLNSCRSFLVRRHHIKKERPQAFFFRIRLPLVAVVGHHHAAVGLGADGVGVHTGDILQVSSDTHGLPNRNVSQRRNFQDMIQPTYLLPALTIYVHVLRFGNF